MEGSLSNEWRIHASTFSIKKKQSHWRWTVMLVKKLWLVAFNMWEHCCIELYKNGSYNKVQELKNIDNLI